MTVETQHYLTECGCMYSKDSPYPWHICPAHFAKGLRLHDPTKSLRIEFKATDFALANPQTVDLDIVTDLEEQPDAPKRHYWLYAIKLQNENYYVGVAGRSNPFYRIMAHGDYLGARWTMKHQPVELLEVRDIGTITQEVAEDLEHKLTLAYMQIYGHKHVRGGRVTYTGRVFKIGKHFIRGNQIVNAIIAACFIFLAALFVARSGL